MTVTLVLLLNVVWLVLSARILVDFVALLLPAGTLAHQPVCWARAVLHWLTEPILAPARRVVPRVRLGRVTLDLAIVVELVAVWLLRAALRSP